MAKKREFHPLEKLLIERVKNSPRAQRFIVKYAAKQGVAIDPNNLKAILDFLKSVIEILAPLLIKLI